MLSLILIFESFIIVVELERRIKVYTNNRFGKVYSFFDQFIISFSNDKSKDIISQ